MKSIILIITVIILDLGSSYGQEIIHKKDKESLYNTSQLSIYFGWNRGMYTKSTVHLNGSGYDFILKDLKATDRQTEFSLENYFKLKNITIPQTNMGFIYQISNKASVSFNIDHMKYVVVKGQETTLDGNISEAYGDLAGSYNNQDITLNNGIFKLEHTDGLNYVNFGYSRVVWQKPFLKHLGFSVNSGGSVGFMLPKTNSEILGKDRHDEFHLSGYGLGLNSGLRLHIGKPFFFAFNTKGGFINMPNIRTSADKNDKASQHFFFLQGNFVFGFTINLEALKKPLN